MFFFTYGVLSPLMLRDKVGPVTFIGAVLLRGYVAYVGGDDECGAVHLRPDNGPDARVLGLVFDLTCYQLELLDALMGVHQGKWSRVEEKVEDPCFQTYTVHLYLRDPPPPDSILSNATYAVFLEVQYQAYDLFSCMRKGAKNNEDSDQIENQCDCPAHHHKKNKKNQDQ